MASNALSDNSGERSRGDRRQYSYDAHIPERRDGEERRDETDRRGSQRSQK